MAVVQLLAVDGLAGTSAAFKQKLVALSQRLGLNPDYIAATISLESRFDPHTPNKYSGAVGLIQWLPKYAPVPIAELRAMSAIDQLDLVEDHYRKKRARIKLPCDYYFAVFSPKFMGWSPLKAAYTRPPEGCPKPLKGPYCQNQGLDRNKDGVILVGEVCRTWNSRLVQAAKRPPILVDMKATPPGPGPPPIQPIPATTGVPWGASLLGLVGGFLVTQWVTRAS